MDPLIIERSEGVVRVTMNAPEKKNAASGRMFEALRDAFIEVERNDADRAMVLTGADGNVVEGLNPIIAICRCGKSQNQPFCDGSHSK